MKLLLRIPGQMWLAIAYAVLGSAFFWAANQPPKRLSGSVFTICLLLSWVPAYVYANRDDIVRNKSFWISQGGALLAGLVAYAFFYWKMSGEHDAKAAEAANEGTTWSVIGAVAAYWSAQRALVSRVGRVSRWVEHFLETRIEK